MNHDRARGCGLVGEDVGEKLDAAILVLPGTYGDEQLGLLLGIARACGLPVAGLVDAAVAASPQGPDSHRLHLDLQLHRAVLTELVQGSELARREIRVAAGVGLATLQDAWVHRIAERFVRDTRFDPLHDARTEQTLYDALPSFLRDLQQQQRAELAIDARGKRHAIQLERRELIAATTEAFDMIAALVGQLAHAGRRTTLLLSHRAGALPGLAERLSAIGGVASTPLPDDAPLDGVLRHREMIRSEGPEFTYVTSLPLDETIRPLSGPEPIDSTDTAAPDVRAGDPPTHLLLDGRAYPIDERPLVLGVAVPDHRRGLLLSGTIAGISRSHCSVYLRDGRAVVEDHSRHGSFLNGRRVEGSAGLIAGDRLRVGAPGIELRLIRVVQDDGAPPA